jgi:mono/diheme cytochrome c family protein
MCLIALCIALPIRATELTVDLGHGVGHFSAAQLLANPHATLVTIPDDVTFHRTMHFRAVPLKTLLPGIAATDHLQFVATDGFIAEIPAATILNHRGTLPWLAVEDPREPWPLLKGKDRVGPFYVVWTHPAAAGISPEQWPYRLASIRRLDSVTDRFPAIVPGVDASADGAVQRGFRVFQRTCFACHTLNGQGDARLGPDLNIPHNPTEYLRADLLRAYIRNPQSLRQWPEAKMPGFPTQTSLSDNDLNALLAYLQYMARHKATP